MSERTIIPQRYYVESHGKMRPAQCVRIGRNALREAGLHEGSVRIVVELGRITIEAAPPLVNLGTSNIAPR